MGLRFRSLLSHAKDAIAKAPSKVPSEWADLGSGGCLERGSGGSRADGSGRDRVLKSGSVYPQGYFASVLQLH
jgi:hypothetical protein